MDVRPGSRERGEMALAVAWATNYIPSEAFRAVATLEINP